MWRSWSLLMSRDAKPRAPRRTQQERAEEMRRILRDATVESLIEVGYARTTTLEVQRRADVSRGALLYHFPSKAMLLVAAVHHFAVLRIDDLKERQAQLDDEGDRVSQVIDMLWEMFSGPIFYAALELWNAARTDEALREALVEEERQLGKALRRLCRELFGPTIADKPRFLEAVDMSLLMIRGMGLTTICLLYTSPSPRDRTRSRMPSSA